MGDIPTRLDLYAIGRDYVVSRAKKIDGSSVDVQGSDANIFVGSASVMAFAVVKQLLYSVTRLFLSGANGEDLDRYAFDRYEETRKGASSALGTVRLYRKTFVAGGGDVPIGTKLRTKGSIEYVTTSVATFGGTDLVSKAFVRAVQAGKATQVGANFIREFAQIGSLFDTTLQVNNDAATAGGEDAEEDEEFRNRLRDFWRAARRGVLGAIETGALRVPGVVSAQAFEVLGGDGEPARIVYLYIADSSGVASDALGLQVKAALDDYRAAGIKVLILTSLPTYVSIELRLRFRANVDTVTLTDSVRAAIVSYVNSLPVNGTLEISALYAVLQRYKADGLIVTKDVITSPVGDIVPTGGQTIRTTLSRVTAPAIAA